MRAFGAIFVFCAGVWAAGEVARADDLVMPYRCSVGAGDAVSVQPSAPARYAVQGAIDDKPFADCTLNSGGNPVCTTVMVHRFSIACAGGVVSWARVAQAAQNLGLPLPAGLPQGYAPITAMEARLVLPALARFSPHQDTVESEALRAEAVVYHGSGAAHEEASQGWSTVINAEMRPEKSGNALRVSGILAVLLGAFLTLGLFSARQHQFDLERGVFSSLRRRAGWFAQRLNDGFARLLPDQRPASTPDNKTELLNAISILTARLAETELAIATLPRVLSLRGVLEGELESVRVRLGEITKRLDSQPHQRSAALVRGMLRDLSRIMRVAQGALNDANADAMPGSSDVGASTVPESLQDAYRILGLNGDAAPSVAKKLVDALRMTWHPDFARDDEDRRLRETRMKQINAAWDLVKNRPMHAA